MIPGQSMIQGSPTVSPNGTAPRCEHLDGLARVEPQSADCRACRNEQAQQAQQASLVACLTCGWVACSDDSPSQHAKAHYEETDHPVAASFAPEAEWRWCYVHQRLV